MAIPAEIQALATKVRNEVYGCDVREAIAKSIEETGKTAAEAYEITQNLIDGTFDEGILSTQIEQKLLDLEAQYAPQLTSLTAELADITHVYRSESGGGGGAVNTVVGYEGNAVSPSLFATTVGGGGALFAENVIGGIESTVGVMTESNVVDPSITNAHYSSIYGGYDNVVNGLASGISLGMHCLIKSTADHSVINGGSYHIIEGGSYNTIGGGFENLLNGTQITIAGGIRHRATGEKNTISGGADNQANGTGSSVAGGTLNRATQNYSTVGGGTNNLASGSRSTVAGGENNTSSGLNSVVNGGKGNVASGENSVVPGGQNNSATSKNAMASGEEAKANNPGQKAFANGKFSVQGDAQISEYVLRGQTTDATARVLGTNGSTSSPLVPSNSFMRYKYTVIARSTDGDVKAFDVSVCIKKDGTSSVVIVGSATKQVLAESSALSWDVDFVTGASSFAIRGLGQLGKTINWVAELRTVEVIS